MRQLRNILSSGLLAAILAGLLFCVPALGWGGSSAITPQAEEGGIGNDASGDWFDKGVELYGQGKYEPAIQAWDEAIKINPQYAVTWSNKGVALNNLGRHEEAIKAYDQAIKIDPQYAEAWNNKGIALIDLGKYEEAIGACDKAIKINPQFADAWNNKGLSLYKLGKYSESINAIDQAIKINPQLAEAWINKGNDLNDLGNYSEAISAYDLAIKFNPHLADAWNGKGGALYRLAKNSEALDAFDQAIKIDPQRASFWHNKGLALQSLGNYTEAGAALVKARDLGYVDTIDYTKQLERMKELNIAPVGYKNVEMIISNETGFKEVKLVEKDSGKVISVRTEAEAQKQSSMDSSWLTSLYDDPQIYDIIATWKSNIINRSNVSAENNAAKSATKSFANLRCICNSSGDQSHPVVGGNNRVGYYVAWMDNRTGNPDIYIYSLYLEKELPFAVGPHEDMYPDIDGSTIVWISRNPLNRYSKEDYWPIWGFNMSNASASEMAWGLCDPAPISLRDNYLTYTNQIVRSFPTMVYKMPLYGEENAPTIPPAGSNPRSGGDFVVFQSHKNDSWDIHIWKRGDSPVPLQSDGYNQINPSTDGHTVVWQDNRTGNWDIYAYDLNSSREMQITKNRANQTQPDVDNGVIVWQDNRNGNWDLYAYDLKAQKEKAICTDAGNQTQPRIKAGLMVWTDDRNEDLDIYLCGSPSV